MINIIVSTIVLLLFISGCIWKHQSDKKDWNNGVCPCEKDFFKSFYEVSNFKM